MNSLSLSPVRAALARMGAYLEAYENGDTNALDALDRIDLSLASNVEDEILFLENLDGQLEKAHQAIKIAKERVKALENLRQRVGDNLLADMNEHGLEEIEGLTRKVASVRNGGVLPTSYHFALGKVENVISEEDQLFIPDKYITEKTIKVLNKPQVLEDLRNGVNVDFASQSPRGRRLVFKPL